MYGAAAGCAPAVYGDPMHLDHEHRPDRRPDPPAVARAARRATPIRDRAQASARWPSSARATWPPRLSCGRSWAGPRPFGPRGSGAGMIRMIGGEMPSWTEDRPPAGGALYAYLLDQLPDGASVLVAGPHADALVDTLHARTRVTCLLRSQPEADRPRRPGCRRGSAAPSPSSPTPSGTTWWSPSTAWTGSVRSRARSTTGRDSLRALKRVLRPGGTLLLAVENELGVHRLVDPATPTSAQTDGAWRPLGEFDTKPGNPTRLAAKLAAEGLAVDWLGAAWPLPGAPTLIATPNALQDGPVDALAAAAASAVGRAYAGKSVLSDPRRLAAAAVRARPGRGVRRRLVGRRPPRAPVGRSPLAAAAGAARRRSRGRGGPRAGRRLGPPGRPRGARPGPVRARPGRCRPAGCSRSCCWPPACGTTCRRSGGCWPGGSRRCPTATADNVVVDRRQLRGARPERRRAGRRAARVRADADRRRIHRTHGPPRPTSTP